ncbi:MAG TPA: cyclase family protein [Phycisphaerae bacterium]|nr:cyclase family protein [Phycisphaerae bacterium]
MGSVIDLTHPISHGLVTDPRLPAVNVGEVWSRAASAKNYAPGVSFQIARVEFAQNTGTYVDCPWHRYDDGLGVWNFPLERFVDLPTVVVDVRDHIDAAGRIDDRTIASAAKPGRALLLCTGWSKHWGTDEYGSGRHPWISGAAAQAIADKGVTLYGIDTLNADSFADKARPVHSILLRASIPIIENLTNVEDLLGRDVRLFAAPLPIEGLGSCPVRAFAIARNR